jgi:hypothetical protein
MIAGGAANRFIGQAISHTILAPLSSSDNRSDGYLKPKAKAIVDGPKIKANFS